MCYSDEQEVRAAIAACQQQLSKLGQNSASEDGLRHHSHMSEDATTQELMIQLLSPEGDRLLKEALLKQPLQASMMVNSSPRFSLSSSCLRMYSMMISSVILPELTAR